MPIKNEFFGVNKTLQVGGKFVIAESAKRSRSMKTNQKNFIQGTAANRIMDIGGASETISISAPILIGGGSLIDGRTLLNNQIRNALLRSGASLPILESARITVSEESGMVELELKSDGNPNNIAVFNVTDHGASSLSDSNGHNDVLNPLTALNGPTRTAKFYDFRVSLAGFTYYVKSATVTVEVEVEEFYFLGGLDVYPNTTSNGQPVPTNNIYNFGTQFPWLGVAGIKVGGSGTAAALLTDTTGTDYNFSAYGSGDSVNVDFALGSTEITLQMPGQTITSGKDFQMDIYDANFAGGSWRSLFSDSAGNEIFNLSKSLISKADFKVETGVMTVDFEFKCYVKDAN